MSRSRGMHVGSGYLDVSRIASVQEMNRRYLEAWVAAGPTEERWEKGAALIGRSLVRPCPAVVMLGVVWFNLQ
jgi:hypothetical protein